MECFPSTTFDPAKRRRETFVEKRKRRKLQLSVRKRAKTEEQKEVKRLDRLMKNREAAQTSRDKRKAKMSNLEEQVQNLLSENDFLKGELEKHKSYCQGEDKISQENEDLKRTIKRLQAENSSLKLNPGPVAEPQPIGPLPLTNSRNLTSDHVPTLGANETAVLISPQLETPNLAHLSLPFPILIPILTLFFSKLLDTTHGISSPQLWKSTLQEMLSLNPGALKYLQQNFNNRNSTLLSMNHSSMRLCGSPDRFRDSCRLVKYLLECLRTAVRMYPIIQKKLQQKLENEYRITLPGRKKRRLFY